MLNLDTRILIYALSGSLRPRERTLLSAAKWSMSKLHVWPIDLAVARESTRLDFHGDPADELIAATSVVHEVLLLTRDRRIRRSKLVPLA